MASLNSDEKQIGIERINKLFETLKQDLKRIGEIENTIQNTSVSVSEDQEYNTYDELELIIKAELKNYKKSKTVLLVFKWMLILFEALSGYLTIGLITHAIDLGIKEEFLSIFQLVLAIAFSFAIVNFAINSIKSEKKGSSNLINSVIAFGAILALPVFNVAMIYFVNVNINFKEIYIVSLFFTAFTGSLLVLKSKEISKDEEKRMNKLNALKKLLEDRKKKYDESRIKFINIFKENIKYENVLTTDGQEIKNNPLYSGLIKFIEECKDFDEWSSQYISAAKENQNSLKSIHKR